MNISWQGIAQCLRDELAEYGALLRLFEAQQRCLFERNPDGVLQLAVQIENQARVLGESRTRRETAVSEFAVTLGCSPNSTLRALLPRIEADARPLLEALISEVNLLLHRVRRGSRHNHTLLTRTVELHRDTLLQLQPNAFTKTYSPGGRVSIATPHGGSTLRAAG